MKVFLKFIQHISFALVILCLFHLVFLCGAEYETVKTKYNFDMDPERHNISFKESELFDEMFENSIGDIVTYGALKKAVGNLPEAKRAESASELGFESDGDYYSRYEKMYKYNNTNLNYFIYSEKDKEKYSLNNMDSNSSSVIELKKLLMDKSDKYVFYDYSKNILDTNIKIDSLKISKLINNYAEIYGDNVQIMIGCNKDLTSVNDSFNNISVRFNIYNRSYYLCIIGGIIFGLLYIALFIYLSCIDGYSINKDDNSKIIKLQSTDYIPFEIRLLLFGLSFLPLAIILDSFFGIYDYAFSKIVSDYYIILEVIFACAFVCSMVMGFFYYGLLRRFKGHIIWNTSLCCRFLNWLIEKLDYGYSNLNDIIKAFVPAFALFVLAVMVAINRFNQGSAFAFWFIILLLLDIMFGVFLYKGIHERNTIINTIDDIVAGNHVNKINTNILHADNKKLGEAVNKISDSINLAVEKSMKDEKTKAELITNVSHDLKTPLTSIINYIDLLKREDINNPTAWEYIAVLDEKSQRLKQLTDDLVEASKISSGNVILNMERINVKDLFLQATGEFADKFDEKQLSLAGNGPENDVYIMADSRSIYRVIENLFNNVYKYALAGTRFYIDMNIHDDNVSIILKNISEMPLTVKPDELTERFVRGEDSRTTEGSGLGLSIAKSLTEAMGGTFEIAFDGDLFKVIMNYKLV